jgi:hypothetical protein
VEEVVVWNTLREWRVFRIIGNQEILLALLLLLFLNDDDDDDDDDDY